MAQLIKLESGQYLNLDSVSHTDLNGTAKGWGGDSYIYMTNGAMIEVSPKDLEKIDQMALHSERVKAAYDIMTQEQPPLKDLLKDYKPPQRG